MLSWPNVPKKVAISSLFTIESVVWTKDEGGMVKKTNDEWEIREQVNHLWIV